MAFPRHTRSSSMIVATLALGAWAGSAGAAGTVQAEALGIAGFTEDFHRLNFTSGTAGTFIKSITYQLPFGFYDFDAVDNFANQTAPILHAPSLVGLAPADVSFSFSGQHPTSLTVNFVAGAFAPGDALRFAADLDGAISDVGGGFGGGDGTLITVTTYNGQGGSAHFATDTSVRSFATVNVDVPEPGASSVVLAAVAVAWARRGSRRRS
jgi:hypothetical protein